MTFQVLDEALLLRIASPTLGTVKGSLSRMKSHMADKLGFFGKSPIALRTRVRLVAGVGSPVPDEIRLIWKAFPTVRAGVGPLPRVKDLMLDKPGLARKRLFALGARVGPVVGARPGLFLKKFPALGPRRWLFSQVVLLVCGEHRLVREAFPAL